MRSYRNALPRVLYAVVELLSPPEDLFVPVLSAPAGMGETGIIPPQPFTHRYKGLHALGLEAERKVPMPLKTYDWGARFTAKFYTGTHVALERTIGDAPSPWWNSSSSGLDLLVYRSPGDVPFWPELTLEISLLESSNREGWPYGNATWYVRRLSHK